MVEVILLSSLYPTSHDKVTKIREQPQESHLSSIVHLFTFVYCPLNPLRRDGTYYQGRRDSDLKIPKGESEVVNWRTENTMDKRIYNDQKTKDPATGAPDV